LENVESTHKNAQKVPSNGISKSKFSKDRITISDPQTQSKSSADKVDKDSSQNLNPIPDKIVASQNEDSDSNNVPVDSVADGADYLPRVAPPAADVQEAWKKLGLKVEENFLLETGEQNSDGELLLKDNDKQFSKSPSKNADKIGENPSFNIPVAKEDVDTEQVGFKILMKFQWYYYVSSY